jgi:hypothetical protein
MFINNFNKLILKIKNLKNYFYVFLYEKTFKKYWDFISNHNLKIFWQDA